MATKEQCPAYDRCGFVKFRKERPFGEVLPLPEDGDCGKDLLTCGRLSPHTPFTIEDPRLNGDEMRIALPDNIPGTRKKHRIITGTDK